MSNHVTMTTLTKETNKSDSLPYGLLTAYLWVGAFCAGYFFEVPFLSLNALLFIGLAFCIWRSVPLRVTMLHGWLLLLIGCYWLSCIYAVDLEGAILEAGRMSSLLPVALMFASLSIGKRDALMRQWAWLGAFLTVWGLAFGLFREGRLESTFGYANVLAIILLSGMGLGWRAYLQGKGKRYIALIAVQGIGLFLTQSRAVLLLFLLFAAIEAVRYWLRADRKQNRGRAAALVGLGLLVLFVAIAAAGLRYTSRVMNISWGTAEFELRRIYWSDSWQLIKQHWLLGYGGGGWAIVHPPGYFVKYVHQFYLQLWLDVGLLGLLAFVGLVVLVLRSGLRGGSQTTLRLFLIIVILLHIAFDIEFAFPLCFGLFVMFGAEMLPEHEGKRIAGRGVRNAILLLCLLLAVGFSWSAVGYSLKSQGVKASSTPAVDKLERASSALEKAGVLLPWAHSVHYELAKAYVNYVNETKDRNFIEAAGREIDLANRMLPGYSVYQRMQKSLFSTQNLKKWER
ncbi:O-antigen ligase [Paenibacillus sp. BC26]|uniref:O-antigen ligase family protein n=1 Tax=Paenibacillus sp. BC26 TaxID=1881032 RepID=UPI0008E7F0CB|nr:O-antigen ligase family protein [Paenibacillus sp. BC26]SFT20965.1 O-antigen ligase [Paenibacillus sp. BC26]